MCTHNQCNFFIVTPCPYFTRRDKIPATASVSVPVYGLSTLDATRSCHTFRTACESISPWKRTVKSRNNIIKNLWL